MIVKSSVRPNTEYSAEYSAKNGRIFGTEYSANFADTPITENGAKMMIFDHFWSFFCPSFDYFIFILKQTIIHSCASKIVPTFKRISF